ncbi:hypothetical protein ACN38_g7945 [Penicillium nordicum]|uniref:Uncharacterized protein n=1 Tax=Penicillium nordicum TaxID=229535 RepID=A0A0M8P4K4_9EURO|nr:hypothetical protein ACN38_g7945 [Penicillium nordicum]
MNQLLIFPKSSYYITQYEPMTQLCAGGIISRPCKSFFDDLAMTSRAPGPLRERGPSEDHSHKTVRGHL